MTKKKYSTKLTQKQKIFAEEWADGNTKTEAYRRAYDTSNMSDRNIKNKAYELSKHPLVLEEYTRLIEEQEEEAYKKCNKKSLLRDLLDTKEQALRDIKKNGIKKNNLDALMRATEMISKLKVVSELDELTVLEKKLKIAKAKNMIEQGFQNQGNSLAEAAKKMNERIRQENE